MTLTNGHTVEGITRFYHNPNDDRPIVLLTEHGEVQIASDMIITCLEAPSMVGARGTERVNLQ